MSAQLAPRSQASQSAIMAQLAKVLRHSASSTNIESVISATGVSTEEIFAIFGGKRQLILAMVAELSEQMSAPLALGSTHKDARAQLLEFAQRVTDIYADSHLRGLYRIALTESIRHTGLGNDFYEQGPGQLARRLADFFRRAQVEGAIRAADPQLLASHFLSALRANLDAADTYALNLASSPLAHGAYVRSVVDLFFTGIDGGAHHGPEQTITSRTGH